jgi:hypothetical protein
MDLFNFKQAIITSYLLPVNYLISVPIVPIDILGCTITIS